VTSRQLRATCKDVLARRPGTPENALNRPEKINLEPPLEYTTGLYQRNLRFLRDPHYGKTMWDQIKIHYESLHSIFHDLGIQDKPQQMLFFSVANIEMILSRHTSTKVTTMATMSQSDVTLPVSLVWGSKNHPKSTNPNLFMNYSEDSRPDPGIVFRYIHMVISRIKERPLLFVFGGHAPVLSERLVSYCTSQRVLFYCVPKDAARYVFPPLHGGPLFLLKKELQTTSLSADHFLARLKHQMWSSKSVRQYSIARAFNVTGFYPINSEALKTYHGMQPPRAVAASRKEKGGEKEDKDDDDEDDEDDSGDGAESISSASQDEGDDGAGMPAAKRPKLSSAGASGSGVVNKNTEMNKEVSIKSVFGKKPVKPVFVASEPFKTSMKSWFGKYKPTASAPADDGDDDDDDDDSDAAMVIDESADEVSDDEDRNSEKGKKKNKLVVNFFPKLKKIKTQPTKVLKTTDAEVMKRLDAVIDSVITSSLAMYNERPAEQKLALEETQRLKEFMESNTDKELMAKSVTERERILQGYTDTIEEVSKVDDGEESEEESEESESKEQEEEVKKSGEESVKKNGEESVKKNVDKEKEVQKDDDEKDEDEDEGEEEEEEEKSSEKQLSGDAASAEEEDEEKENRKRKHKKKKKKKRKAQLQEDVEGKEEEEEKSSEKQASSAEEDEEKENRKRKHKKKKKKKKRKAQLQEDVEGESPSKDDTKKKHKKKKKKKKRKHSKRSKAEYSVSGNSLFTSQPDTNQTSEAENSIFTSQPDTNQTSEAPNVVVEANPNVVVEANPNVVVEANPSMLNEGSQLMNINMVGDKPIEITVGGNKESVGTVKSGDLNLSEDETESAEHDKSEENIVDPGPPMHLVDHDYGRGWPYVLPPKRVGIDRRSSAGEKPDTGVEKSISVIEKAVIGVEKRLTAREKPDVSVGVSLNEESTGLGGVKTALESRVRTSSENGAKSSSGRGFKMLSSDMNTSVPLMNKAGDNSINDKDRTIDSESPSQPNNKSTSEDGSSSSSSSNGSKSGSRSSSSDSSSNSSDNSDSSSTSSADEGNSKSPPAKKQKIDPNVSQNSQNSQNSTTKSSTDSDSSSSDDGDSSSDDSDDADVSKQVVLSDDEDEDEDVSSDEGDKCQLCMRATPPHSEDQIINWVDCDRNCGRWFHIICILRSKSKANPKKFVCPSCRGGL